MTAEKDSSDANDLNLNPSQSPPNDGEDKIPLKNGSCCANLKMFIAALCFVYFAKAFSGSYMKSSITQIERRFDVSSSIAGIIDGSFELGNLLMIAVVSYFGAIFHRPRIIAVGCLVMSIGSFLTAMPHFFMGHYKYETAVTHENVQNNATLHIPPCLANQTLTEDAETVMLMPGCEKETSSYMWVCVLIGNMLRGIGESPVAPLGISYLDDFSKHENTPFYIAIVHTVAISGPMVGFMLGSLCARLYVDIGFVDIDRVTITPQDTRWVGAWWLGFLIAGVISLLAAVPFCFLPKSLNKPGTEIESPHESCKMKVEEEEKLKSRSQPHEKPTMKGFFIALKKLFGSRIYVLFMLIVLLQMSSHIGFVTYKPKYMEQQYGLSISKANFMTGVTTLPAAVLGVFLGGLFMKKFKLGILGASKLSCVTSLLAFLLSLSVFLIGCENTDVAGITVTYDGSKQDNFQDRALFSSCNSDCRCSPKQWDPVCGGNGITYMSACFAGCVSSQGAGKDTVYHNCSCIEATGSPPENVSATLGTCPKGEHCSTMFTYYIISQAISTFLYTSGIPPIITILLWSVSPELKSLSVGFYTLIMRTIAGIPAPIYFGALIDKTCLKWGSKVCGGKGSCRMYDATSFRNSFLGLSTGIRAPIYILYIVLFMVLRKQFPAGVAKPATNEAQQEDGTKKDVYTQRGDDEQCAALNVEKESCI
ncbi:hypothetical protein FKM82_011493 [Ascaphus truei]|uniref:solute carrier organic anion transporter family member 1C1-like n=1 Tax=Ascaphus truei TaxID=8439 RepID=UPI003F59C048